MIIIKRNTGYTRSYTAINLENELECRKKNETKKIGAMNQFNWQRHFLNQVKKIWAVALLTF